MDLLARFQPADEDRCGGQQARRRAPEQSHGEHQAQSLPRDPDAARSAHLNRGEPADDRQRREHDKLGDVPVRVVDGQQRDPDHDRKRDSIDEHQIAPGRPDAHALRLACTTHGFLIGPSASALNKRPPPSGRVKTRPRRPDLRGDESERTSGAGRLAAVRPDPWRTPPSRHVSGAMAGPPTHSPPA